MDRLAPQDGGKKEDLRGRLKGGDLLVWLLLVAGAAIMVFPLYWMFATAVRPKKEIFSGGFDLVPSTMAWSTPRKRATSATAVRRFVCLAEETAAHRRLPKPENPLEL